MSRRLRELRLSRARAALAAKPAMAPEPTEEFAKKANDLEALQKNVEDAATVSVGFWLSYLFALFYIGIAAVAVTHRDLLLENPVKLPFLNIELPLLAFFIVAPILFLITHTFTLVHLVMLAVKVGLFSKKLTSQIPDRQGNANDYERINLRQELRQQLPPNILVQFLAGPREMRGGILGFLLWLIVFIGLVFGPVLLLLLIQVRFLPYHSEPITWLHRLVVLIDIVLLWFLWPAVLNSRSKVMWLLQRRGEGLRSEVYLILRHIVWLTACFTTLGLAFTAATFPGENMEDWIGNRQWIWPNSFTAWLGQKDSEGRPIWTSFHDLLFNGEVDDISRRPSSLFSNTLVLPDFDALEAAKIEDPKKLDSVKQTLILRARHLESAIFYNADLRKADLSGAYLQDALLAGARLQGAKLDDAQLQGAWLTGVLKKEIEAVEGPPAGIESEFIAQLQGASLNGAQLQGATLDLAQLQGAKLDHAQLQGASLWHAQLQGTLLNNAQLQGASLVGAHLDGASLDGARLQGANFRESTLAGTNMSRVTLWRTGFEDALLAAVLEDDLQESALSKYEFAGLKAYLTQEVPEGGQRDQALERIKLLNPDIVAPETSVETLEKRRCDFDAYQKGLADQLKRLACSPNEYAPYIVRGLIANNLVNETGARAHGLVEAILEPDCPVSAALTEVDKVVLKRIAKAASGAQRR